MSVGKDGMACFLGDHVQIVYIVFHSKIQKGTTSIFNTLKKEESRLQELVASAKGLQYNTFEARFVILASDATLVVEVKPDLGR